MANIKYIFALTVIAVLAGTTFAIHCYQCESISNTKCGEHFEADDVMKYDCSRVAPPRFLQSIFPIRNATGCMKKTLEAVNGHPQIIRSCYFGEISNTQTGCQADPSLPFVKQLSCDVCADNLCNSSNAAGPMALAIVAFFALARLLS
ncbi:UPAR/Ly6 domain-containing protein bero-like [Glossina fuscipes fuscipes]